MKATRRVAMCTGLAALISTLGAIVWATERTGESVPHLQLSEARDTLRGLQGIHVIVEYLKPEVKQLGLTCDALRTDAELQLRQYGIKVLDLPESIVISGSPYLYINVGVLSRSIEVLPLLAVSINVQLKQTVLLARNPTIRCKATTWEVGSVAQVGRSNLADVRDVTSDLVARFINDYLTVNPKADETSVKAAKGKRFNSGDASLGSRSN
ncbi:MAG: hypothetical protein JW993_13330 [Sedimentisphaerales bacterium]|nr:hypothetical protein [Sedimentisphaerales bacterium]